MEEFLESLRVLCEERASQVGLSVDNLTLQIINDARAWSLEQWQSLSDEGRKGGSANDKPAQASDPKGPDPQRGNNKPKKRRGIPPFYTRKRGGTSVKAVWIEKAFSALKKEHGPENAAMRLAADLYMPKEEFAKWFDTRWGPAETDAVNFTYSSEQRSEIAESLGRDQADLTELIDEIENVVRHAQAIENFTHQHPLSKETKAQFRAAGKHTGPLIELLTTPELYYLNDILPNLREELTRLQNMVDVALPKGPGAPTKPITLLHADVISRLVTAWREHRGEWPARSSSYKTGRDEGEYYNFQRAFLNPVGIDPKDHVVRNVVKSLRTK